MYYRISKHCKDRFIERILNNGNSPNIYLEIINKLKESKNITSSISNSIPRFVLYIKERYGCGINFLESKDGVIFILRKVKNTASHYEVITCYSRNDNNYKMYENSVMSREEIHRRLAMLKHK